MLILHFRDFSKDYDIYDIICILNMFYNFLTWFLLSLCAIFKIRMLIPRSACRWCSKWFLLVVNLVYLGTTLMIVAVVVLKVIGLEWDFNGIPYRKFPCNISVYQLFFSFCEHLNYRLYKRMLRNQIHWYINFKIIKSLIFNHWNTKFMSSSTAFRLKRAYINKIYIF